MLTGCGPDANPTPGSSPSPPPSATQSPSPSSGPTNKEGTVRERLATGLQTTSPDSAGVCVDSARVATGVATTFLDTTRTFASYSYRIASVGDIKWRPNLDPAQQGAKTKVEQTYGDEVTAPRVRHAGDDWSVQLWMVDGTQLVRHELTVAANGTTSDSPVTVVRDLPVPASR
jgi:hypothetical protein